jgi:hypothetical protein
MGHHRLNLNSTGGGMATSTLQNRRRSPRILLQIPVLLRGQTQEGEPIQGHALTLVVSGHGGLLETALKVSPDQKLDLVNQKSGETAACKVLRVEESYEAIYTVAFEFDHCNPQFWPVDLLRKHQEASE